MKSVILFVALMLGLCVTAFANDTTDFQKEARAAAAMLTAVADQIDTIPGEAVYDANAYAAMKEQLTRTNEALRRLNPRKQCSSLPSVCAPAACSPAAPSCCAPAACAPAACAKAKVATGEVVITARHHPLAKVAKAVLPPYPRLHRGIAVEVKAEAVVGKCCK